MTSTDPGASLALDRSSYRAREALVLAQDEALREGLPETHSEHLLIALLRLDDGVATRTLERLGVSVPAVRAALRQLRQEEELGTSGLALTLRATAGGTIGTGELLRGIANASKEGAGARVLERLGVRTALAGAEELDRVPESGRPPAAVVEGRPALPVKLLRSLRCQYRCWRRLGCGRRGSLDATLLVAFPAARTNELYLAKSLRDWWRTPAVYRVARAARHSRREAVWVAASAVNITGPADSRSA